MLLEHRSLDAVHVTSGLLSRLYIFMKAFPLFCIAMAMLSSCATQRVSTINPDLNRDGRVSDAENVQYTRQVAVQQSGGQAMNQADVDKDGLISDTEWAHYNDRQVILDRGHQQKRNKRGATGAAIGTVYQSVSLLRLLIPFF